MAGEGRLCRELALGIYVDDQDECLANVGEETRVFKVRNGGNFDFAARTWLSTVKLTRLPYALLLNSDVFKRKLIYVPTDEFRALMNSPPTYAPSVGDL